MPPPQKKPKATQPEKRVPPKDMKRPRSAYLIWKARPENKGTAAGELKERWKRLEFSGAPEKAAAEEAAKAEAQAIATRLMEWYVDTIAACEREADTAGLSHGEAAAAVERVTEWSSQMRAAKAKCFSFDTLYKLVLAPDYAKSPALYKRFEALETTAANALATAVAGRDALQADAAKHAAAALEQELLRTAEAARGITTAAETVVEAVVLTELTAALAAGSAWREEFDKPEHEHAGFSAAVSGAQAERSRLQSLVAADASARQAAKDDAALIKQLQSAPAAALRDHAVAHRRRQETIVLLEDETKSLRGQVAVLEEAARQSTVQSSHAANFLPSKIARALEGQLAYTGPRLKNHPGHVQYTCGGVSLAVFARAFGVAAGCTTANVSAVKLGVQSKRLRYGSVLALADPIAVRLNGDQLTASGSYMLF